MKNNLALVKPSISLGYAEIHYATITAVNSNLDGTPSYLLQLANLDEMIALKAESCLMVPEIDDLVLATSSSVADQVFILQILHRVVNSRTVDFGQNAVIAGDNLKIAAKSQVVIESPEVILTGIKGRAIFSHSYFVSNWCEIRAKKVAVIIHNLDRVLNTVTEKILNSFRTIEGIEQTKAKSIRTLVTERLFFKAKQTTINAEEDVSIDGKKIHIG